MKFEIEMQGFKELDSYLSSLARKDEKINKATVKAGGAVLAKEIKKNAPRSNIGGAIPTLMKILSLVIVRERTPMVRYMQWLVLQKIRSSVSTCLNSEPFISRLTRLFSGVC